jgi:ADP-ribose pyrophosphatase YjhB (NUDIX family)
MQLPTVDQERGRLNKSNFRLAACSQFRRRHVFRAGAVVWTKFRGQDFYLVFRSLNRPYRGIQIPGGRVEKVENTAQAILREIKEETGLDTKIVCPLGYMFFNNEEEDYSNLQIYYIVRPLQTVDVTKSWYHTDQDETRQRIKCWWVSVEEDCSFLSHHQHEVILMFRQWLEEHKKTTFVVTPAQPLVDKSQFN